MNFLNQNKGSANKSSRAALLVRANPYPLHVVRDDDVGQIISKRKKQSQKQGTLEKIAKHPYSPAICGLSIFGLLFVSGILIIFIRHEERYKGLGIIMATLGFLGGFAFSLYFQRKRKVVKTRKKKKKDQDMTQEQVVEKPRNMVDSLMLKAITNIEFRACDELKGRGVDGMNPNKRRTPAEAIFREDYAVVNS